MAVRADPTALIADLEGGALAAAGAANGIPGHGRPGCLELRGHAGRGGGRDPGPGHGRPGDGRLRRRRPGAGRRGCRPSSLWSRIPATSPPRSRSRSGLTGSPSRSPRTPPRLSPLSRSSKKQAADDSGIQTLYNGILSIGPAASQAEMEAVDALSGIGSAAASDAESGIETFLGGIYWIRQAADEAGSQVADAMGNARQAVADTASAFGSVDYSAATEGLGATSRVRRMTWPRPPQRRPTPARACPASSACSASGFSYMAVDPFAWMYAAPVVIEGGIGCDQRPEQLPRTATSRNWPSRTRRPVTTSAATRS